jgi:hypothetical protein
MEGDKPIKVIAAMADEQIGKGFTIWQKWTCLHCGSRQTMDVPNVLYTSGKCQNCGVVSAISECGFMMASDLAVPLLQESIDAT